MTRADKGGWGSGRPAGAVWLLGMLALAAAVRFWGLGRESIWLDEAISIWNATEGVAHAIRYRAGTLHPPLYELALGCWVRVAGRSEAAVRFPSAVFGVLACYWVYLLGKELADRRVGLVAGLLTALAYYPLKYSQEARMYSMLMALSVASVLLVWRAVRGGKVWTWVGLGFVNVVLVYTHLFGFLVVGVENLFFLYVWLRTRRGGKAWLAVQAVIAVAFLPWAEVVVVQVLAASRQGTALSPPTWTKVWRTLICFFPLNPRQGHADHIAIVYCGVALLGLLWVVWRGASGKQSAAGCAQEPGREWGPGSASAGVLLTLWLVAPFAVTLAASKIVGPCYVARCLIVAAPPATLLLGLGICALGKRGGTLLLLGCCALAFIGVRRYHHKSLKEHWRQVARYIEEHRREGDCVVICSGCCAVAFEYYCREPQEVLPRYLLSRGLGCDELEAKLPGLLAGKRRVWLVLSHAPHAHVRAVLDRAPWAARVRRVPKTKGVRCYLYVMVSAGSRVSPFEPGSGQRTRPGRGATLATRWKSSSPSHR